MADCNIPDIIKNATRLKHFMAVWNLLRSKAEYTKNLLTQTKDDYQEAGHIYNIHKNY